MHIGFPIPVGPALGHLCRTPGRATTAKSVQASPKRSLFVCTLAYGWRSSENAEASAWRQRWLV